MAAIVSESENAITTTDNQEDDKVISPEGLIKHPLQNEWTLWFFKNDKSKQWCDNNQSVTTFNTIEDFWSLYNHIQPASRLQSGCDYSLFKHGIQPMWEDEANRQGGRWLLNLSKAQRFNELDNYWLEILLCLIGEAFDEASDEICGAVVNIRPRGDKLAIWTADYRKAEVAKYIGSKMKERLNVPQNITIGYQMHGDTIQKSGSTTKNKYYV